MDTSKGNLKEILDLIKSNRISPQEGNRLIRELRESSAASSNGNGRASALQAVEPTASPFQAVVLTRPGGIDDIQIREVFPQEPQDREVQILVQAFSINFGALLCVKGLYPTMPDYPFTPGFEVSGVVLKTGKGVSRVCVGDEVIALAGMQMGGHGAVMNAHEGAVVKKPANITHVEACAFPIVFLTMQRAFELAQVKAGEKVLIQTAAGGTGLISVQMAQALGAEVFATAGSQEKLDYLATIGVRHLINYREEDFAERVMEMTGNRGVDVVFNTLSGDAIQKGLNILAPDGRYVELAMTGLKTARNISLSGLDNNQIFYSIDLRKQLLQRPELGTEYLDSMVLTLSAGRFKSIVGKVFPFSEVKQAYKYLADRKNIGKIVVSMPEINLNASASASLSKVTTVANLSETHPAPPSAPEIAVIGMAARFPGAKNVDEFWRNLAAGQNSVTEIPKERWDIDEYYDADLRALNKTHCRFGGFLSDIDKFDPVFFNISGREAQFTDPQQRLFLEESWTALEDAGYATPRIANARCGVFVGVGQSDYLDKMIEEGVEREAQAFWGNDASVLTARLSYFLNLKGAAIAINTACSSSLVAIHLACQSIHSGESELAIAGGVFIRTTPSFHIINSNAAMLSPDGKCMTFDNKANGYVPGEGVGVLVLKSLEAAERDGDHIYGVIKSSGTNQDGKTNGITAPSTRSQTELELSVYQKAGINPETLSLIEAHGTGTKLGDPIEIEALTNAFRKYTEKKQYCAIGSVKTNIGHTVAAAGVAGVIKVLLALKHKQLPPSLNFDQPNEHINFADSPFYVNTVLRDWETVDGQPRRAAASSFGFSGTNAHLVIEEPPAQTAPDATSRPAYLFTLSAKTTEGLQQKANDLLDWLETEGRTHALGDVAYTLHQGRSHFAIRAAVVAGSIEELQRGLRTLHALEESQHYLSGNLKETPHVHEAAQKRFGQELLRELRAGQLTGEVFQQTLHSLAGLYVKGYELDWNDLYAEWQHRRISLPTYPFARERYWIQTPPGSRRRSEASSLHPLLDSIAPDLSLQQQGIVFRKLLPPTHPVAKHHQVQNQSVVPGVGHLEMAYAALSQIRDRADYKLINVVWLYPLIVRDTAKEVQVVIKDEKGRLHYIIQSDEEGKTVVHSRGEFCRRETASDNIETRLPINDIKARCMMQCANGEKPFAQLQAIGICYGTFFQALTQLWEGQQEALGLLELPSVHESDFHEYFLHPTIMDGALQATIGLTGAPRSGQPVLPFGVEEVELFHPLKSRSYAHVTPGRQALQFNVTITDESGLVCAKIHGAAFREMKDPLQKLFYVPAWKRQPLTDEQRVSNHTVDNSQGQVLIIHTDHGSKLVEALVAAHSNDEVVTIRLGSETKQRAQGQWEIETIDAEALDKCLSTLKNIRTIYFLGGIQPLNPDPADLNALALSQETGVISLFRLVKSLISHDYTAKALRLNVVVNEASEINRGATRNPYAASLIGFCKSLAKEQARWEVSCLDVSLDDDKEYQALVAAIRSEPRLLIGEEVAVRRGTRYVRTIRPLSLPSAAATPFKSQGVYLILGGAGGIGLELSNYLAETVQARLVLLGRSELNEAQQEKLARIEARGGKVLYLQADATDSLGLKAAVEKAKEHFGQINGVIHSAIVLDDKTLENMDERVLRSALAPKVTGSVALYHALQDEELDFMLFFSSAQSFCGNPGQSNYAAACTFKDAYADYLRGRVGYPVKVINWGYWGEVGIVATEEHQRRLAAQGIYSISPAEGMETVKRTLAQPVTQVMPIKADEHLLLMMGMDLTHRVEILPDAEHVSLDGAIEPASQPDINVEQLGETVAAFHRLDALGQYLLLAAFQRMGVFLHSGERYAVDELRSKLGIIPAYVRLYEALLRILDKAGFVRVNEQQIISSASLDDAGLQDELKHLESKKKQLTANLPGIAAHLRLLWTCAQRYPEILRGELSATDVIFPGHSMEQVESIYKGNVLVDYFNQLVAWSLQSYIESRLSHLRENEKITILEIGAGTGGTSAALFNALSPYAHHLRYLYTDISQSFTQYGKRQYGAENPYVEFRTLDIEREVEGQGYAAGTCDVVVATNVLHATRSLERTLSHAKSLLKTHGWLVVNEVTESQDFTTLTFGLLEGWWLYEDMERRLESSPLLSAKGWQRLLEEQGFERVVTLAAPASTGRALGQNVIIAESDGLIIRSNAAAQKKETESLATSVPSKNITAAQLPIEEKRPVTATANARIASVPATTSVVDKETLRLYVETKIIESLAAVLQLSEDVFDKNAPYTDFGVDSLLAVDIINALNEVPGISLRSTDLFNYATVRQLTDYIAEECEPSLRVVLEVYDSEAETLHQPEPEVSEERSIQPLAQTGLPLPSPARQTQDIAIIGMSGQFPEAEDIHQFWDNLSQARNSVREITRWKLDRFYDPDPGTPNKSYGKWGGMIDDIHLFDPAFFNISPKEAELMDPQQRLFLQETWKALEDAGYSDKQLEGKACSVFVGCGPGDYNVKLKENNVPLEAYSFTGNASSILAARISYLLNLKGPSVPIDTACSSSLVALHLACESIRHGTCEMAIAGGVAVMNTPDFHILGSRGGMLSAEGQCKTFDQHADGFVPGETVGCLILKSVEAALRDHDHIYGVISGSGINQDGKTNGITSPSAPSQTALECEVYDRFGIDPAEITYVEAHGTGTRLGDPIEVQALTDAFGRYTAKRGYCGIGSVKTNIGHTLTAAGVASVIKVLLSLKHQQLPPSLNFQEANRHIEFGKSPFYVNTELREWAISEGQRRQAAISSFGFSGTNAHLVIREADEVTQPAERAADARPAYLLVISAKTSEAVKQKVFELYEWLCRTERQTAQLRDIAYTLQVGRSQFRERVALVAGTIAELKQRLSALLEGKKDEQAGCYGCREEDEQAAVGKRSKGANQEGAALLERLRQMSAQETAGAVEAEYLAGIEKLAELYVSGVDLAWSKLYEAEEHRRISLPTYPFAREHYYAPEPQPDTLSQQDNKIIRLHPLLERNISTLREEKFITRLTGREFFLADHIVFEQRMLPGVAYLEMARAAGSIAGERRVSKLKNVFLAQPISFTEASSPLDVTVRLYQEQEKLSFEISSCGAEAFDVVHAQGTIIHEVETPAPANPEFIDLEAIRQRCPSSLEGAACYRLFESGGVKYGTSFRALTLLHYSKAEGLAHLELPSVMSKDFVEFVLHPSLIDAALQAIVAFKDIEGEETAFLPVALGEIELIYDLPETCYAHVLPANSSQSSASHLKKFNILIADDEGRVRIKIKDFAVRALRLSDRNAVRADKGSEAYEPAGAEVSGDDLLNILREIESGTLKADEAERLLDGIYV